MPKRNKHDRPKDPNQLAHYLVAASTEEQVTPPTTAQISVFMAELGRKGGKIGGKRRMETMTDKQRKAIAKKAAQARWKRKKKLTSTK